MAHAYAFEIRVIAIIMQDGKDMAYVGPFQLSPSCALDNSGGNGPFRAGNMWANAA